MELQPSVVLVDDDPAARDALRLLMKSVGLPLTSYASAQDFLQRHDLSGPGCLVLDVRLPGMSGLELQQRLLERGVDWPIIVITGHADVPMTVRAIKAGALDLLEKPFNDQVLLERIQQALKVSVRRQQRKVELDEVAKLLATLTPREREVLDLIVAGKSNKTIALELGISRKTLDIHRSRVLRKMQVESVVQLVRTTMGANMDRGVRQEG